MKMKTTKALTEKTVERTGFLPAWSILVNVMQRETREVRSMKR